MVKYVCDRCGKEIEFYDSVIIEAMVIDPEFFHLCKDCYDELNRWCKAMKKDHNADWVNVVGVLNADGVRNMEQIITEKLAMHRNI